jgi:excisionase family DNA binding protein
MTDKVFSTGEVAQALGVSRTTITRAGKQGFIKRWQTPGGHFRYLANDVQDFKDTYLTPMVPRPEWW